MPYTVKQIKERIKNDTAFREQLLSLPENKQKEFMTKAIGKETVWDKIKSASKFAGEVVTQGLPQTLLKTASQGLVQDVGSISRGEEPQFIKDVGYGGLAAVNTAGFGLPGYATKQAGFDITPERPTLQGQALQATGSTLGVLAPLPLPSKINLLSKADDLFKTKFPKLSKTHFGETILNAGKGFVLGALQTNEDNLLALSDRGFNGATGALIGSSFPLVASGVSSISNLSRNLWRKAGRLAPRGGGEFMAQQGRIVKRLSEKYTKGQGNIDLVVEEGRKRIFDRLKRAQDASRKGLNKIALNEAKEIQKDFATSLRDVSKQYGNELTIVEDKIEQAGGITAGEMKNVLESTVRDSIGADLDSGAVFSELQSTLKKFKIKQKGINVDGSPILELVDPELQVPFREAIKDIRRIRTNVSKNAFSATQRANTEDIPFMYLNKNWGEMISEKSEDFRPLQKMYSQTMRDVKPMLKVVKPYGSDLELKQLGGVISRAAKGEVAAADYELVKAIEEGRGMFKGVGIKTNTSKLEIRKMEALEKQIEKRWKNLQRIGEDRKVQLTEQAESMVKRMAIKGANRATLVSDNKRKLLLNIVAAQGGRLALFWFLVRPIFKKLSGNNSQYGIEE